MSDQFGLGLNYNYFDLDVDVMKSGWRGRLETRYRGFIANMSFYWQARRDRKQEAVSRLLRLHFK